MQALADPYFDGLANVDNEPSMKPFSKFEFEFERRKLADDDVRELIYREVFMYIEISSCLSNIVLHFNALFHLLFTCGASYFKMQTDIRVPSTDASGVSSRKRSR